MATWRPFSITSFKLVSTLRRQGLLYESVVDGGANVGQFARAAIECWPDADVYAFEPLPEVAETLRRNLADRPSVRVFQCALGPRSGNTEFYRHQYSLASSVLRSSSPSPDEEAVVVETQRLDDVLGDERLKRPLLMKLDLQGYELQALHGAVSTLDKTDAILIEVGFDNTYVGGATFDELYTFLREHGFKIRSPVDFLTNESGAVSQLDLLFCRPET